MPTISDIQLALQRCMEAEPPVRFALSPDASQLATVFAELRYAGKDDCEREALTTRQLEAFDRWTPAPS